MKLVQDYRGNAIQVGVANYCGQYRFGHESDAR